MPGMCKAVRVRLRIRSASDSSLMLLWWLMYATVVELSEWIPDRFSKKFNKNLLGAKPLLTTKSLVLNGYLGLLLSLMRCNLLRAPSKPLRGRIFPIVVPNKWPTMPGHAWSCWSGTQNISETTPSSPTLPKWWAATVWSEFEHKELPWRKTPLGPRPSCQNGGRVGWLLNYIVRKWKQRDKSLS